MFVFIFLLSWKKSLADVIHVGVVVAQSQGSLFFSSDTLLLGERTHSHGAIMLILIIIKLICPTQPFHPRSPVHYCLMDTHSVKKTYLWVYTMLSTVVCVYYRHGTCHHCTKSPVGQIESEQVITNSRNDTKGIATGTKRTRVEGS